MVGQVGGAAILVSATVAVLATWVSGRQVPPAFYALVAASIASGAAALRIPWDRVDPRWLHVVPIATTVELALGIRVARFYGETAANYYIFVGVFAAYAFSSRWAVLGHLSFVSVASAVTLVYHRHPGDPTAGRIVVQILTIMMIGVIVMLLREALQRRQRELEALTVRDPLTGVGNYRLMSERLDYELERHRRSGASLTVILLDLDGFKAINDNFGHLAGDRVLIWIARTLKSCLRAQDTLARQGGDEFSILAPSTDDAQAAELARRVQDTLARESGGALGASLGWATFPADASDADGLLGLADVDLRRVKQRQRRDRLHPARDDSGLRRLVESTA
jgi:diguanylate cyclase (GGDEF)-like protein